MLILGGTGWLGREVARAAAAGGDAEVVCLARGVSGGVPEGVRLMRADRRRPGAYEPVAGQWDEVVELSYDPDLVASALDALADRAAHWTLVSSCSVYARTDQPHADESAELVEPRDLTQYPDAKVAAERASAARLADRLLIARPGLIAGPGDPSDRFGYWPARLQRGGRVLAPRADTLHVQVIDVADLAGWIERADREGMTGAVNTIGPSCPMAEFLDAAREVCSFRGQIVEVDDDTLFAHDVRYWAGPRSLPLWLPPDHIGFSQRDTSAFRACGGTTRPLRETIARCRDDELARGLDRPRRSGLTPAEEEAVLDAAPAS